jgi:hypothetical protein
VAFSSVRACGLASVGVCGLTSVAELALAFSGLVVGVSAQFVAFMSGFAGSRFSPLQFGGPGGRQLPNLGQPATGN